MIIFVVFPEDIEGIPHAMKSSARWSLRKANSSRYRRLGESPRMPSLELAATLTSEPLASCISCLFHRVTPICSQYGRSSYDSRSIFNCSLASISLLASIATLFLLWNIMYHIMYPRTTVDFPTCLLHLLMLNLYFSKRAIAFSWYLYILKSWMPSSLVLMYI